MNQIRAYVRELDPNQSQKKTLFAWAFSCKKIFNWGLETQQEHYATLNIRQMALFVSGINEKASGRIKSGDLVKLLQQERETNPFWQSLPAQSANAIISDNLESALKNFFSGRTGYPNRKTRKDRDSIPLPSPDQTFVPERKYVWVRKLGNIKLKEVMPMDFKPRSATIYRRADRWYISVVGLKRITIEKPNHYPVIGVDRGVRTLAVRSDGIEIPNNCYYQSETKKRRRLQRKLSRQVKYSNRWYDTIHQIQRLEKRISDMRSDSINKATTKLVDDAGTVVIEDLNIKGMRTGTTGGKQAKGFRRSVNDAGMGEFGRQVKYKAAWQRKQVVLYPRFEPSTKKCSSCGNNLNVKRGDKTVRCSCGLVMDRDLNAAKVLQSYGERKLVQTGPVAATGSLESVVKQINTKRSEKRVRSSEQESVVRSESEKSEALRIDSRIESGDPSELTDSVRSQTGMVCEST